MRRDGRQADEKARRDSRHPVHPPTSRTRTYTFTQDRISAALNRAADKVCALAPQDVRLGDAINLVANAALHILEFPDADLEAVVEAKYSEDVDTVLGWVRGGH